MKFLYILILLQSITLFAITDFSPGTENYELAKKGLPPVQTNTVQQTVNTPVQTNTVQRTVNTPVQTNTVQQTVNTPVQTNTVQRTVNTPVQTNTVQQTVNTPVQINIEDVIEIVSVTGQGVAPPVTKSPAQAYALAKRSAITDAYRQLAERIKGVKINGNDTIKNMMIKRSVVRLRVNAILKNTTIVETTFKNGLCEVEMEVKFNHRVFK